MVCQANTDLHQILFSLQMKVRHAGHENKATDQHQTADKQTIPVL